MQVVHLVYHPNLIFIMLIFISVFVVKHIGFRDGSRFESLHSHSLLYDLKLLLNISKLQKWVCSKNEKRIIHMGNFTYWQFGFGFKFKLYHLMWDLRQITFFKFSSFTKCVIYLCQGYYNNFMGYIAKLKYLMQNLAYVSMIILVFVIHSKRSLNKVY